jgi:hypothetical protein
VSRMGSAQFYRTSTGCKLYSTQVEGVGRAGRGGAGGTKGEREGEVKSMGERGKGGRIES